MLKNIFLAPLQDQYKYLAIENSEQKILDHIGEAQADEIAFTNITLNGVFLGKILAISKTISDQKQLAGLLAPILDRQKVEQNLKIYQWVENAKKLAPEICDWIGIYFKSTFLYQNKSTDLVLGPFIGEATEHTLISQDRGICGLAIRTEQSINVEDVRERPEHIACSLTTRSELVIPLKDNNGNVVAELDIDSNKLGAFKPDLQMKFEEYAEHFFTACYGSTKQFYP